MKDDDDDGLPSANASGIVSDGVLNYLKEKFPKEGDNNDGNIDAGMKDYLDEKFRKSRI